MISSSYAPFSNNSIYWKYLGIRISKGKRTDWQVNQINNFQSCGRGRKKEHCSVFFLKALPTIILRLAWLSQHIQSTKCSLHQETDAAARITPEGPQPFLPYIFQWQSTLADITMYWWKWDSDILSHLLKIILYWEVGLSPMCNGKCVSISISLLRNRKRMWLRL